MKQITITINLDPIMDGIKGDIEKSQGTAGTFFVLGTNYEHRAISEKEFYGFIDQMKEYVKQIVIGDYLLIYDDRNALAMPQSSCTLQENQSEPVHAAVRMWWKNRKDSFVRIRNATLLCGKTITFSMHSVKR